MLARAPPRLPWRPVVEPSAHARWIAALRLASADDVEQLTQRGDNGEVGNLEPPQILRQPLVAGHEDIGGGRLEGVPVVVPVAAVCLSSLYSACPRDGLRIDPGRVRA